MNRRQFLNTTTAAAAGFVILKPRAAFGYQANSAVRHGLLGCGGRGTTVATSFAKNTTAQVVALADLFPDQLAAGRAHFDQLNASLGAQPIADKLAFQGPHAFERLAASRDVDLIQISTPPFFHVQHLGAAVAAGKHVYCEKPMGIDVRQAKQAIDIGRLVRRAERGHRLPVPQCAALRRHRGEDQGRRAGQDCRRHRLLLRLRFHRKEARGPSADEARLRNWLWDRALSGDILVEQNIHIIDLCNWMLGAHPVKASATGGRNVLTHAGDCWDNYQVDFTYPGDVHFSFASTQFGDYKVFDAGLSLFGANGSCDCALRRAGADSRAARPGRGRTQ